MKTTVGIVVEHVNPDGNAYVGPYELDQARTVLAGLVADHGFEHCPEDPDDPPQPEGWGRENAGGSEGALLTIDPDCPRFDFAPDQLLAAIGRLA